MRVIVGAGGTVQPGWLSLEQAQLDIRDARQWGQLFKPASLDAVLAEHVFEHLDFHGGWLAARNCYEYLKRGGYLRIAVPDGFHPSPVYQEWVSPGGYDPTHLVLYNVRLLTALLESIGYQVRPLEFFDEYGCLHVKDWQRSHGYIFRSYQSFYGQYILSLLTGARYTSLIVDAVKV